MRRPIVTALGLLLLLFMTALLLVEEPAPENMGLASLPLPSISVPPSPTPDPLVVLTSDQDQPITVAQEDGSVVTMPLSEYLVGVVSAEMPASFHPQALMAQSVAARTYTLDKLGASPSQNHPEAAVCTDHTCCQAYLSPEQSAANWGAGAGFYSSKVTEAVSATDGQVILYDGEAIAAFYFSSAPGSTLDGDEVFVSDLPYLVGVASPEGEEVPNYQTTVTVPVGEFSALFAAQYPQADLSGSPDTWFSNRVSSSNGGVASLDVGGVTVDGHTLRMLFGLRATHFTPTADQTQVSFVVTGYGHGVGMSQYGAETMAQAGSTWQEILTWYYTDVTIGPYTLSA